VLIFLLAICVLHLDKLYLDTVDSLSYRSPTTRYGRKKLVTCFCIPIVAAAFIHRFGGAKYVTVFDEMFMLNAVKSLEECFPAFSTFQGEVLIIIMPRIVLCLVGTMCAFRVKGLLRTIAGSELTRNSNKMLLSVKRMVTQIKKFVVFGLVALFIQLVVLLFLNLTLKSFNEKASQ